MIAIFCYKNIRTVFQLKNCNFITYRWVTLISIFSILTKAWLLSQFIIVHLNVISMNLTEWETGQAMEITMILIGLNFILQMSFWRSAEERRRRKRWLRFQQATQRPGCQAEVRRFHWGPSPNSKPSRGIRSKHQINMALLLREQFYGEQPKYIQNNTWRGKPKGVFPTISL